MASDSRGRREHDERQRRRARKSAQHSRKQQILKKVIAVAIYNAIDSKNKQKQMEKKRVFKYRVERSRKVFLN